MQCANCSTDAVWVHDDPGALPVYYCDGCLPQFLRARIATGTLNRVPAAEPVEKPTRRSKATK